ncbi:MAG: hypothetical protein PHR92_06825 [Lachnospiraceae bacterium]|nr:hypothetical protein [Lachnospiraceae bacterium]
MNKSLWIASCCLIIIGLLFLLAGVILQYYQQYKEPLKGRTTGKVVELLLAEPKKRTGAGYKNYYYPIFEYFAEGKLYKVRYPYGAYPSPFHINQEIKLCYNKEDPLEYQIAEINKWKLLSSALYGAGVISVMIGCIIFLIFAVRG